MPAWLRKWTPLILLIAGMTVYLHLQFKPYFKCPSCYLFVNSGDGLKNYFTSAYFIKHDSGGVWSRGMNYPYGEHIVYTDNQPIVSKILKGIDSLIGMDDHVIGTINMVMILGLILAAIFLYYIMREFGLPRWYSALLSLPIALLSPQIARFYGHYSLAYTFYLPLFILLLIRWAKAGCKWRDGVVLTGWIGFMGFTHLYYFFIAIIFLTFFGLVHWTYRRFKWNTVTMRSALLVIASVAVVYGTVKLTDPVTDRPESVYGLDVYTAKLKGTFLPWFEPFSETWKAIGKTRPDIEGTSYLGGPAVIMFLPILVWMIVMIRRRYFTGSSVRSGAHRLSTDPAHPLIMLSAGILVWSVATGWFYSIGGGKLVDLFPVIGQFRSLGRLAWIFYYVLSVSVAYAMYNIVKAKEARWKSRALTVVFGVFILYWYWESHAFIKTEVVGKELHENNTFRGETPYLDILEANGMAPFDFQASFQIPITSIGSEKISIERGGWWMRQSWQSAWETGLPIIPAMMSRTSVSQSLSMLQLISDPWIEKQRLEDMDDRPLLLIVGREEDKRIEAENRLITLATPLGTVDDVDVYSLPISAFKKTGSRPQPDIQLSDGFENGDQRHSLEGTASFLSTENMQEFYSFTDTFTTRSVMELSIWTHITAKTPFFSNVRHEIYNVQGDKVFEKDHNMRTFRPYNVIGEWIERRFYISVDGSGARHSFKVDPPGSRLDDLRIW